VVEKYGETAIEYRTVVGLDREVEGNSMRWRVHSRNGEGKRDVDESTLVIGADGVNSVLRKTLLTKSLFFDEEKHNSIHRWERPIVLISTSQADSLQRYISGLGPT
jgi:2-polyprenyl-6-methoxyphenol hydroxylase-like FAD-dependent oxidoreductase